MPRAPGHAAGSPGRGAAGVAPSVSYHVSLVRVSIGMCAAKQVKIWCAHDGRLDATLSDARTTAVYCITQLGDADVIACGTDNNICIWRIAAQQLLKMVPCASEDIACFHSHVHRIF
eukprot:m.251289 g.251289  ORF g.251289 m.251289 type:complete len:117 (+) comp19536_c0_seq10:704-1054(+)